MIKNKNNEYKNKLKEKLRELFQFDSAELDFGIYRIMNYKRKEIENFIENDLIKAVENEFKKYKRKSYDELANKIKQKEQKIKEDFGYEILKNGKLKEKYGKFPIVKDYLKLKKQSDEIDITENIQSQVFNDLYTFFSRYYEDGDFISKRRYSTKQYKYAIPYSGEEVKLYWANFDQYYIKTSEVFKDFEFVNKGWKFIFRTNFAEVEVGNVKGNRKYFFLSPDNPIEINPVGCISNGINNKTCIIKFDYRHLTNEDLRKYPVKTKEGKAKKTGIKQYEINKILKNKILYAISPIEPEAILGEIKDDKTYLEKNLYKYTKKVTSDFFIHKDLKNFLERELDYFIKTEVLNIDSLEIENEIQFDKHITRTKVVRNIGKKIIEFLAQIEDFQKMLWEKKKFVLKTDYMITIDRIPEEFHKEIIKNKEQLKEWKTLGFIDDVIPAKAGIHNKKLPVDTKYFSQNFKERLLEKITEKGNLDDLIDGILIKSENLQALNLLLEKYKEKIQCIYIDPPFNTGTNEFLYKNKYLDSSWISMIYDRLNLGKKVLKNDGSIYVRIDYHGNQHVRNLLDILFGKENFRNEIIVNRFKKPSDTFATVTESFFFYSKNIKYLFNKLAKLRTCTFCKQAIEPRWHLMISSGEGKKPVRINQKVFYPPKGQHWKYGQENVDRMLKEGRIRVNQDLSYTDILGKKIEGVFEYLESKEQFLDSNWTDINGYKYAAEFSTENAEEVIQRVIASSSNKDDWVFDYFLGSGTTTAVAHKLGRKWIGIEMGDYFENVPLKRMKKVLYYDKSGISKDKEVKKYYNKDKAGGFFKYQYLEQYEDTLHNIEFTQEKRAQKLFEFLDEDAKTEYLLKYILKFETEGSQSLMNIEKFENPYEYKLKIISGNKGEETVNVDLVETFNYLLGFKVNRYKFIKANDIKYTFVFGEKDNRKVAVVWRSVNKKLESDSANSTRVSRISLEKDKEIIDKALKDYNPDEIFINGDSFVKVYKPIENEFKILMGV